MTLRSSIAVAGSVAIITGCAAAISYGILTRADVSVSHGRDTSRADHEGHSINITGKTAGSNFQINAQGQTYGVETSDQTYDQEPDLILVVMTNGQEGYVPKSILDAPMPSSPSDAVGQSQNQWPTYLVPAYASDGVTVIGQFQMGG